MKYVRRSGLNWFALFVCVGAGFYQMHRHAGFGFVILGFALAGLNAWVIFR